MSRVVHFEIYADDPERAVKFYTSVFDWKVNKWQGPMIPKVISLALCMMTQMRNRLYS